MAVIHPLQQGARLLADMGNAHVAFGRGRKGRTGQVLDRREGDDWAGVAVPHFSALEGRQAALGAPARDVGGAHGRVVEAEVEEAWQLAVAQAGVLGDGEELVVVLFGDGFA